MIRRVFMSTINYSHPQTGMIHAFQGIFGRENVHHYDYLQRLRETNWQLELVQGEFLNQAIAFTPDWAWLQLQTTDIIKAGSIQKLREALPKCVVSHWMGDIRSTIDGYLTSICKATHMTLTSSKGYLPMYLQAGAPEAHYLQIGLDWDNVCWQPEWTPPFRVPEAVFIGNCYTPPFPGWQERENAVRALHAAGIDVGVVGDGWGGKGFPVVGRCHVKEQIHVWKRAKVCISVNHFPDVAGYYSDRHLTALLSGTPVVCRYIPALEEEFQNGKHLLWYRTEEELVGHVRTLLADEPLRCRLGAAGRAEVISNHTWFSRVTKILPAIETLAASL